MSDEITLRETIEELVAQQQARETQCTKPHRPLVVTKWKAAGDHGTIPLEKRCGRCGKLVWVLGKEV